jgi:hypothetical protein
MTRRSKIGYAVIAFFLILETVIILNPPEVLMPCGEYVPQHQC